MILKFFLSHAVTVKESRLDSWLYKPRPQPPGLTNAGAKLTIFYELTKYYRNHSGAAEERISRKTLRCTMKAATTTKIPVMTQLMG